MSKWFNKIFKDEAIKFENIYREIASFKLKIGELSREINHIEHLFEDEIAHIIRIIDQKEIDNEH